MHLARGYDSMIIVGLGSLGVGCTAMVLGNMLAKQFTIGWFKGKYRAAYSEVILNIFQHSTLRLPEYWPKFSEFA